jgi:hypothetical protein
VTVRTRRSTWGIFVAHLTLTTSLTTAFATVAHARGGQHFEPTDLALEDPGTVQFNVQTGFVRGPTAWRFVGPDTEVDFGITPRFEVDFDFAIAGEGRDHEPFAFDHSVFDNGWLSSKIGLFDAHNAKTNSGWALGLQMGPKLPISRDAHGIGYEALLMGARHVNKTTLVLNAGGLIDPAPSLGEARPTALEVGLDVSQVLDDDAKFALLGELGLLKYAHADGDALQASAGLQWSPNDALDMSAVVLVGTLNGADRFGVLFGFAPKLNLF